MVHFHLHYCIICLIFQEGLECAVCLCQFEDNDILRLLPKCQHAFHVDCVDLWLASHSTCPLCRHCVSQEDLSLVEKSVSSRHSLEALQQELAPIVAPPPLNASLLGTLSSKEVEAPIQVKNFFSPTCPKLFFLCI
jgi:hypothetical protein